MTETCYIGRGLVLAKLRGSDNGYIPLAAEGDISFVYGNTVVNIVDHRSGAGRVVDTVASQETVQLQMTSGKFSKSNLVKLMGHSEVENKLTQIALTKIIPAPVVGATYYLGSCEVSNVVLRDATLAVIPTTKYTVDASYGFIVFSDVSGITLPVTATFDSASYETQGVLFNGVIDLDVIIKGTNKITNEKFLVELYKPRLNVTGNYRIISREFSTIQANLVLFADYTKPDVGVLGVYGKTSYFTG